MSCYKLLMGSFGASEGSVLNVADLGGSLPANMLNFVTGQGFQRFTVSDDDVADMALEAIAMTLSGGRFTAREIDTVFLVSESFWDGGDEATNPHAHIRFRANFLNRVMREAGLDHAIPYGVWGAACGSLMPTLQLARSLIASDQARATLIVATDRLPLQAERISPSGSVLFSDVACSCVLSSSAAAGFVLEDIVTVPSKRMLRLGEKEGIAATTDAILAGMHDLESALNDRVGRRFRDYPVVIFESFNQVMVDWLATALGIGKQQIRTPARENYAHAFSADLLLSLRSTYEDDDIDGDILVVSFSTWVLSAAICVLKRAHGNIGGEFGAFATT